MKKMTIAIARQANLFDIPYVIQLSSKESRSIGFIPKMAYKSAVTGIKNGKRWSNVCNDKLFVISENKDLVGFCLASFGRRGVGKIAQICLQEDARLMERGAILLNYVIEYGKKVHVFAFQCGCADDLISNFFWKSMGWVKIGARKGISYKNTWEPTSNRTVNIYMYSPHDLFLHGNFSSLQDIKE
jgi:hypothetical protein